VSTHKKSSPGQYAPHKSLVALLATGNAGLFCVGRAFALQPSGKVVSFGQWHQNQFNALGQAMISRIPKWRTPDFFSFQALLHRGDDPCLFRTPKPHPCQPKQKAPDCSGASLFRCLTLTKAAGRLGVGHSILHRHRSWWHL